MKLSPKAYETPSVLVTALSAEQAVCTWSGKGEITDDNWNNLYDEE